LKIDLNWRWWGGGAAVFLIAAAVFLALRSETEARLVRADPDAVPADTSLMRFAGAHGKSVYDGHCAGCHGETGTGDPARGIPNLTDADWLYGSGMVSEIEKIVFYGIRSHNPKAWNLAVMPAYARPLPSKTEPNIPPLTPQGLSDVTEFVVSLGGRPADAAAAKRGGLLFNGQGGCYDCHLPDGSGDTAIGAPNLTDSIWLYGDGSRESIMRSIAKGHEGVCPAWVGKLTPAEIREVAAYVYTLSHHAGQTGS
jgi:cytochrome c oxidase cbb3-type subunit 3